MSAVFEVGGHVPNAPGGFVFSNGSGGGGGSGFLPVGHFINAKQAMIQIYPRPDTETNTFARHRWAYYDGTNPVLYQIPLGVAFGAFPYVFSLQSGPPGMSIGATFWNTSWGTGSNPPFVDARNAGYGVLQWTPTGSVSGATVSVLVTDQQLNTTTITFTVSTSSSTAQFLFFDSQFGNDSTGTGTISAPWQTMAQAIGTSFSTTNNASTLCYFRGRGSSFPYTMPAGSASATDFNDGSTCFEVNTLTKPSAYMGFPGDALTSYIDLSNSFFACAHSADLFVQNLNPNGYHTATQNCRFFWIGGGGGNGGGLLSSRTTMDINQWTNSGYGSSAGSNASSYYVNPTNSVASYIFINGCSETNRQSGNAGNNYCICSVYSCQNVLAQGNFIIDPTLTIDEFCMPKSNITNGTWRGNYCQVASVQYICSPLQSVSGNAGVMSSVEICYNIDVGGTTGMAIPVGPTGQNYGALWCYRNNCRANLGISCNGQGVGGPYVFENNASQGSNSVPTGTGVTASGNIFQGSGLLDGTTGYLTSSFSSDVGTIGAQIA
jgi:hypothetical protein